MAGQAPASLLEGPGEILDMLAPGCDIVSLGLNEAPAVAACGTAMAAPYAAGSAALLVEFLAEHGMAKTPAEIEELMETTGVEMSDYRRTVG